MSPEYFHSRLTFGEADDYLGGMQRRCYHGYNQARMVESIIGRLFAKNYKVQTFPWEEKQTSTAPPTESEVRDLLREAEAWEKQLNSQR